MILSDIQMPGLDGFNLRRSLQQDSALRHVPFAFVTEDYGGPHSEQLAQDVGVARILLKPFTTEQLQSVVEELLSVGYLPDATQQLLRLDSEAFHRRHASVVASQLERKVAELERLAGLYKVLFQTTRAITRLTSPGELFPVICRIAVEHGHVQFAAIFRIDQDRRNVTVVARHGEDAGYLDEVRVSLDEADAIGRGPAGRALRSGTPVVNNDFLNDSTATPWRAAARRAGIGAVAAYPFYESGAVSGALLLYASAPGFFTAEMLPTLSEMAAEVSFALEHFAQEEERIREGKAIEDALDYNALLITSSPVGLITYKASGEVVSANEAAAKLVGGTVEQLKAQNFRKTESWKQSGLLNIAERVLATNSSMEDDVHIRSTTYGKDIWVTGRLVPFEYKSERHLLGIYSDITERVNAREALEESEGRFRALVEQQPLVGIFLIDDGKVLYQNPRADEIFGYEPGQLVGRTMESLTVAEDWPAAQREIRRVLAGEILALTLEVRGLRKDGQELQISVHGALGRSSGRPIIIGVLQDVTKLRRAEREAERHFAQLESAFMHTVEVATTLSEMRDPYTAGHERRVAELVVAIGVDLGFDEPAQKGLRVAGLLHDIGKIGIPAEICSKPGRLNALELELIRRHAQASYDILKDVEFPTPVAQIALQHHERMDGSGYPQGLKGEAILFEARLMAVADVVEAMASHRPYRAGLGIDKALEEIERGRGSAYDAVVVDACLRLFREKGYQLPHL